MADRLRSDELQDAAIQRIREAVAVPERNVIPTALVGESDDRDPRITVGATLDSTTPHNAREEAEATIRVAVDGTREYVRESEAGDAPRLKTLLADVADELTAHRGGLAATGVQAEEDVAFSEELNRYLGAVEVGVTRPAARRAAQE